MQASTFQQDLDQFEQGILEGKRATLARAITLAESRREEDTSFAARLLTRLMPHTGGAIRLGLTGPPGVGKSSLIDELGCRLLDRGHRVAVLAIDPSSSLSGGSILGDKTRMERLARRPEAFIRPSPTGGTLGGLARRTREAIHFCEAAGFDIVLIETVGVGQSEIQVRQLCDVFLLLLIAGAGDELQGIKRGIMEMAEIIAVNKADGDGQPAAQKTVHELKQAVHLLPSYTTGWEPAILHISALDGTGLDVLWNHVLDLTRLLKEEDGLTKRRRTQDLFWMQKELETRWMNRLYQKDSIKKELPILKEKVIDGSLSAEEAVLRLLDDLEKAT